VTWLVVDRVTGTPWISAPNRAEAYRLCREYNFLFMDESIKFKVVRE